MNVWQQLRSWLATLATTRQVYWLIEQPMNSAFFNCTCVKNAIDICAAKRYLTYAAGFGSASMKPLDLYTTAPKSAMHLLTKTAKQAKMRLKEALTIACNVAYMLSLKYVSPYARLCGNVYACICSDPTII